MLSAKFLVLVLAFRDLQIESGTLAVNGVDFIVCLIGRDEAESR